MEPACKWREKQVIMKSESVLADEPQWSPPVNGGKSQREDGYYLSVKLAAMEPACKWREKLRPRGPG